MGRNVEEIWSWIVQHAVSESGELLDPRWNATEGMQSGKELSSTRAIENNILTFAGDNTTFCRPKQSRSRTA